MLNRRHLRIKVLQTLYAYNQSEEKEVSKFEKSLLNNVDQVYEMYIWLLNLLIEVADYTMIDAEGRARKHLPTENDLNNNLRFHDNAFIEALRKNGKFIDQTKKYRVSWAFDPEIAREIFQNLKNSEEYKAYLNQEDHSIAAEKDIIKYVFKRIILQLPAVEQVFEEKFINWQLDKEVLQALVAKTFKNFSSVDFSKNHLAELTPNWDEDREFILDLFILTISHSDEYQSFISGKTKNWEADRIALMDTLIMRLAICELINFSSIPVKVTINEYIEISKIFSTPKSNTFINGILDKVLSELKTSGRIRKQGRGLNE
ncbi:transcription antitermination factor NusB [Albibacterium bauzanense]|uniref:NusB antitermination factor n=1 Tax=Albibacterium bauzanense TaxID=653929 RepID=A0A4V2PYD8_9SPHI|nr:transcription antitermination factor NusB [Albibacterium bauzanense]TCK85611.1 NusB antitermination factor [Albibacterium bauzanense]